MKLRYTERAIEDMDLAFEWYERQRRGLGFEFLDCVEHAVKLILETPKIDQICHSPFRSCVVRRFPYSIFYTIEENEIVAHAVFDNRQAPERRP